MARKDGGALKTGEVGGDGADQSLALVLHALARFAGHAGAVLAIDEARMRRADGFAAGRAARVGWAPAHSPAPQARALHLVTKDFHVLNPPAAEYPADGIRASCSVVFRKCDDTAPTAFLPARWQRTFAR